MRSVLKSDQEEAIKALKRAIAVKRQADTDDRVAVPRLKVKRKRRASGEDWGCARQNFQASPRVEDQSHGAENIGPDDLVGRRVGGCHQQIYNQELQSNQL